MNDIKKILSERSNDSVNTKNTLLNSLLNTKTQSQPEYDIGILNIQPVSAVFCRIDCWFSIRK
jgi:hypothetical protein